MGAKHDITQSDDQFMAVTDAMDAVSTVIEEQGTEALLVINLAEKQADGIFGGAVTPEAISRAKAVLDEISARQGMTITTGVLHCKMEAA